MIKVLWARVMWLMGVAAIAWNGTAGAAAGGDYARALPGYAFQFPRDHGAHSDYKIEWWYYTGNLQSAEGRPFGFELTFFRTRLAPPGNPLAEASPLAADEIMFAHFAISDIAGQRHESFEQLGRAALGQASAATQTLNVSIGAWQAAFAQDESVSETMRIEAAAPDAAQAAIELRLTPEKPLVIHGENGVHQKSNRAGQASHYLSYTRLRTAGRLKWQGEEFTVSGLAWMDHEFSSEQLGEHEIGWDWFALQLETVGTGDAQGSAQARELMLYQLLRSDKSYNPYSAGTHVSPAGEAERLKADSYQITALGQWQSPATGAVYPMGWRVVIPQYGADLMVAPAFEAQEMDTRRTTGGVYWEGAVRIEGSWAGRAARGVGYVELVGYANRILGLR